ncbi:MAG: porin family protein [Akkermansia sp.]|nr:porin family protein [Akkermansia sp.]
MKRTVILAVLMGLPALGGQVDPSPAASPWGMEVGAAYNWAVPDIYKDWSPCKEIKSIGGDITAVYRVSGHSALTLRFGYSWGGEKWANDLDFSEPGDGMLANFRPITFDKTAMLQKFKEQIMKIYERAKQRTPHRRTALQSGEAEMPEGDGHVGIWSKARVHTFSFMPGYRYTHALTPRLSVYGGVNAGIANASNKLNMYIEHEPLLGAHDSAWGFAYSAELGLSYAVTPTVDVFAAYQFSGNTAKCRLRCEYGDITANRLHYHGIRAGVGFRF